MRWHPGLTAWASAGLAGRSAPLRTLACSALLTGTSARRLARHGGVCKRWGGCTRAATCPDGRLGVSPR